MRLILTLVSFAVMLNARPMLLAQPNPEHEVLRVAVDDLVSPSSGIITKVIRAPAECIPEVIGFTSSVDCVDGKLTDAGRVKAAVATQKLADALGESVAADPGKELRSLRTPPTQLRPRYCPGVPESIAILISGPLVEVEPGVRWRVSLTRFSYPRQFECEGSGVVVEYEVARIGDTVRVISAELKRHYSGVHQRPG